MLEKLLAKNPTLEQRADGYLYSPTPLQFAVYRDKDLMVQMLLQNGADINAEAYYWQGRTALQLAAGKGRLELVRDLIQAGADVNAPPAETGGRTALAAAAENGYLSVVIELLRLGADINAPAAPDNGRTALEAAAARGQLDVVYVLVENNSDLHRLRTDCKRASRLAKINHHSALSRMLDDHAKKLANKLGMQHKDGIDDLCDHQIQRIIDDSGTERWCCY